MLQSIHLILFLVSSCFSCAPSSSTVSTTETTKVTVNASTLNEADISRENKIFWNVDQKLKWSDFQARPQAKGHLDAYSTLGMSYAVIHNTETVLEMAVYGYFEKDKSWVKSNEKTDHLLNHEQSHFDLSELYRRILKKRFAAFKDFTYANVNTEMKRIFDEVFEEYDQVQQRYDRETNHSIVKLKQTQWDEFIKTQIADHQEFAGDFVTLAIRVN
ncbi:MAG: DUF922 domain-containing protein [Saprospiraceae bacterium]